MNYVIKSTVGHFFWNGKRWGSETEAKRYKGIQQADNVIDKNIGSFAQNGLTKDKNLKAIVLLDRSGWVPIEPDEG